MFGRKKTPPCEHLRYRVIDGQRICAICGAVIQKPLPLLEPYEVSDADMIPEILRYQAEVAAENAREEVSADGTTYKEFMAALVARFMWRMKGYTEVEARKVLIEYMRMADIVFPSPAFGWTLADARDLADEIAHEELQYGDYEDGSNE